MDYHLQLLEPPTVEPITLAEAKDQCRVRHGQSDQRLQRLIQSAREQAEGRTRRALLQQTWVQTQLCCSPCIPLQRWPVLAVEQVEVDGVPLASDRYQVRLGEGARVRVLDGWGGREVSITFKAGYGATADSVPSSLKEWMLVQIADAYANPGAVVIGTINSKLDFVDGLLQPFKVPR